MSSTDFGEQIEALLVVCSVLSVGSFVFLVAWLCVSAASNDLTAEPADNNYICECEP